MPTGIYTRKPFSEEHKKNISKAKIGKPSGRLNFKHSEETKKIISDINKGNKYFLGHRHTEKAKKKMSISHINKVHKKHSEETKQKMRESRIKYMSSGKILNKDTSIEISIENELKKVNLNYKKQVPIKINGKYIACVDFFIEKESIIIECDGKFWHNKPERKKSDATKDLFFKLYGFKVFRFTDKEINKSPKNCINKVLNYIN